MLCGEEVLAYLENGTAIFTNVSCLVTIKVVFYLFTPQGICRLPFNNQTVSITYYVHMTMLLLNWIYSVILVEYVWNSRF